MYTFRNRLSPRLISTNKCAHLCNTKYWIMNATEFAARFSKECSSLFLIRFRCRIRFSIPKPIQIPFVLHTWPTSIVPMLKSILPFQNHKRRMRVRICPFAHCSLSVLIIMEIIHLLVSAVSHLHTINSTQSYWWSTFRQFIHLFKLKIPPDQRFLSQRSQRFDGDVDRQRQNTTRQTKQQQRKKGKKKKKTATLVQFRFNIYVVERRQSLHDERHSYANPVNKYCRLKCNTSADYRIEIKFNSK